MTGVSGASGARRQASRRAASLVAGLVFVTGLPVATPAWRAARTALPGTDSDAFVRIARAVATRGTLVLPPPGELDVNGRRGLDHQERTPYAVGLRGELLPKNSWAMGVLLVPGLLLGGVTGAIVTGLLVAAGLAWIVSYRSALDFGPLAGAAAGLVAFLGLPLGRECVWGISLDAALAAALFASAYLAESGRPRLAGLVAGFSPFLRPTAVLLLAPVPFLAFRARGRRGLLGAILAALPGALAYAAANTLAFGAPWVTAYQRALVFRHGASSVESHLSVFDVSLAAGLERSLLGLDGLLVGVPLVVLAVVGFARVPAARSPVFLLPFVSASAVFLLLARYTYQPRFGFTLLAASVPPAAALLDLILGTFRAVEGRAAEPPR